MTHTVQTRIGRGARLGGLLLALVAVGGCAITFSQRSPWDIQQLEELGDQLEQFKTLAQMKGAEADELRRAKGLLDARLSSSEVSVGYDQRGLVARMLDRVLFDSGQATLRRSAHGVLDRVAQVLAEVPDQPIGIEGHTDNQPIRRSGWADNEALAVARAQAVADYLMQRHGMRSDRLTTIGYGDAHPVDTNDTLAGRQKNRRVEIVILPQAAGRSYRAHADRVAETGASAFRK